MHLREVELDAAHDVDIHVRSSFTADVGAWILKEEPVFEDPAVAGVAHRERETLYAVRDADKARENRLRREAARQGLHLMKSRARDPQAPDFGTYMLTDPATNFLVTSGLPTGYGLSLDDVERALHRGDYPGVYRTDETTPSGEAVYTTSRGGRFVSSKVAAVAAHFERQDRAAAIAAITADLALRALPADAGDAERAQAYDRPMGEVIREANREVGIFVELAHLAATAISLLALERNCPPLEYVEKVAMRNTLIDALDDDEPPTQAGAVAAPRTP
ncbi:MAG: hypothetical protein V7646_6603 [Pseudonocardia sp.]